MGHDKLRTDTECQNCGHEVLQVYCPHCGQKNTETRQSFAHLITHFAEDLTHYDSAFWKTIKFLVFRPAKLTIEYLEGKRLKYVPPVKLYIFISFITFLILSFISGSHEHEHQHIASNEHETYHTGKSAPATPQTQEGELVKGDFSVQLNDNTKIHTLQQLDSIKAAHPEEISSFQYWIYKKLLLLKGKQISTEKVFEALLHVLPKVLFLYMPLFAFWLWLFHGKKRWLFFDHGIFTLHYFSLLLLLSLCNSIIMKTLSWFGDAGWTDVTALIFTVLFFIYPVFYFFRAHSKMYGESKIISRVKATALFLINFTCILAVLTTTLLYVLFTMH